MNIAEYSIQKKTISLVLTAVLFIGGIISYLDMPRLEDPEFTIKEALVITNYPGATPLEVADEVTDVLENAIQQMGQLDIVKSENYAGQSIISVEMKDKYDKETLPQVWDELRRKINDVQGALPPGAGPSAVIDDFGDVYGILIAITGDGYSTKDIQDFSTFLRKEMLTVPGAAKVNLWGVQQEAVYIEISRSRMARLGVTLENIYTTLSQRNLTVDAGSIKVGPEYIRVSPTGGITAVEELGDLYIKSPTGQLVYLQDVATIERGYITPEHEIMHQNGQTAVALGISVVSGGNVIDLGEAVSKRMAELESEIPVGMQTHIIYDQPTRVNQAVDSFIISLAEAVGIVIIVLLLFMGMQSGLLIGAILLITISASFIFIEAAGVALERISLGALVIALGMLVDNAIVVVEGLLIRYQQGQNRLQAAKDVINQNIWPLLGATVIAVMAFAGIGLSPDATGEFCRSLFLVILISLMMSWVTAMTVTPLLCDMLLKPKSIDSEDQYSGAIFMAYRTALNLCLRHRALACGVLIAMLALSIFGFGFVKQSFFPDSTQPRFFIHYWMPQGTDIRETKTEIQSVEKDLLQDERIASVSTFIGSGAPRFILTYAPEKTNGSYAMLLVKVKNFDDIDGIIQKYKNHLAENYPGSEPKFKKFKLGPGGAASIEARFSGPSTEVLRSLSQQAQAIMIADGKTECVRDNWRQPVKVLKPEVSEAQARRAGITRPDIAAAIQQNFTGKKVGVYREGDSLLPIISRPPVNERTNVADIQNILIPSPVSGSFIPVGQVVSNFKTEMENGILHTRNRRLTITASCEPSVELASAVFSRIRPQIEAIELPAGYTMEWGGEYEDSTKAQTSLAANLPFPFLIMVLITVLLFNNLKQPLIIWLTVPLAIIGVSCGLLVTGQPFGFMALLGFLSLSGMLIKNSIVLLDQVAIEKEAGKNPLNALRDAAVSRMRPVAMAAATTILGMLPLVADAFFASMAVTIMFGLAFATVLTLLVVPLLYAIFYKVERP
ncbi:MAG: efflux RND transporter permease subunit [Desulfovibrio sp.]